ncbi:glycosyltransferase family 2 protein [Hyphomonas sp. GM-8P]|uniref:glycosyltransferase family 2 protein n=1 Tax=Hyphomonas sp. GM-8P TaxID=1280945 RepID=UPI000DD41C72|nr:glycosyltransferase family 2 protein [Hyphomonas sp. GM-8P]
MPFFSVLIVNYNGGDFLAGALKSLEQQTFRDFEVILVDNNSTDSSIDQLETTGLPHFTILAQSENLGFAGGNNIAAKSARGRWLALLNPDAVADPHWLERVAQATTKFPKCVHFACTQYALNEPERLDGVGDSYLAFGIPWRGGYGLPSSFLPAQGLCFSPCGASAIIRADIFRQFNGFDERLFCYCEDVDLGFRMQLAGHRCIFLPDAVVHHAGSGITDKVNDFAEFHGTRNRIWVYWKNMPLPLLLLTSPGHILISLYLLVRAWMHGRCTVMLKATSAGLRGARTMRCKDSPWAAPKRKVSLLRIAHEMAWNPFRMSNHRPHVRPLPRPDHKVRAESAEN